jgi:uncharacterized protein (DUF2141 family)
MVSKITTLAGLALLALAPATCRAQLADLAIRVVEAGTAEGAVEVSLFNSPDTFMREPFLQTSGRVADDGTFVAYFAAVPAGRYAAVAVHDENNNGKLDNGLFGLGGEGYGFSNNVSPMFGWPDFEDAAFTVEGPTGIEIELD